MKKIKCLIFGGGSIKGISFIGCIKALEEKNILPDIKYLVGTSIGSITCLLINIGYSSDELKHILFNMQTNIIDEISCENILEFIDKYGISNNNKLINIIKIFIKKKNFDSEITFKQLYNLTKISLTITGTCLNNTESETYFNHNYTPDMKIIDAISISTCIPFIFKPINYDDHLFIDGAIINNLPIEGYHNKDEVLAFLIKDKTFNKISNIIQYSTEIINCLYNKLEKIYLKQYSNITVIIYSKLSSLNFNINHQDKNNLYLEGYNQTMNYLNNNIDRF